MHALLLLVTEISFQSVIIFENYLSASASNICVMSFWTFISQKFLIIFLLSPLLGMWLIAFWANFIVIYLCSIIHGISSISVMSGGYLWSFSLLWLFRYVFIGNAFDLCYFVGEEKGGTHIVAVLPSVKPCKAQWDREGSTDKPHVYIIHPSTASGRTRGACASRLAESGSAN